MRLSSKHLEFSPSDQSRLWCTYATMWAISCSAAGLGLKHIQGDQVPVGHAAIRAGRDLVFVRDHHNGVPCQAFV
jgi:hypothetical protein